MAGFPSPADDHMERRLDLNEHLIRNPVSTFFLRVEGDSMAGAGILSGDLIVVDKAAPARPLRAMFRFQLMGLSFSR